MNEQLAFGTDGEVKAVPSKLTEDREAWQGRERQAVTLEEHAAEMERLKQWNEASRPTGQED